MKEKPPKEEKGENPSDDVVVWFDWTLLCVTTLSVQAARRLLACYHPTCSLAVFGRKRETRATSTAVVVVVVLPTRRR